MTLDDLTRLATLARAAGAAALVHYGRMPEVAEKSDGSPVTAADRASHDVIQDGLAAWQPAWPVVSEEAEAAPWEERQRWKRFWLVDPLDGTKEFLACNGEFTVNIALIDGHDPIAGVVYAPALDLLYAAATGLGAWKHAARHPPERLRSSPPAAGAPVVVAESRSHRAPALEAYLSTLRVARRVPMGSSLKFCLVADGTADLYARFGRTMEWDTAAGDCVFRCSGVSGPRTSPLRYNTPTLAHDGFVIGW
jgi:3'(2'), 5'-bisphosphate nucleotidase